ncbi:hypothetical protein DOTSEDRAFT_74797 [Dothistroma septosporum NZE10]|uniref:Uncharacterized protein n=1 Tax=Dothistroma septosporum (strain NZE10 / CBS 128990) TaxID=675120 RepID=N1PCM9_DOTSN|nr:hypothetical protein DOTSEDRAFT_74797 [Dothistroma septosporum NZE10]
MIAEGGLLISSAIARMSTPALPRCNNRFSYSAAQHSLVQVPQYVAMECQCFTSAVCHDIFDGGHPINFAIVPLLHPAIATLRASRELLIQMIPSRFTIYTEVLRAQAVAICRGPSGAFAGLTRRDRISSHGVPRLVRLTIMIENRSRVEIVDPENLHRLRLELPTMVYKSQHSC